MHATETTLGYDRDRTNLRYNVPKHIHSTQILTEMVEHGLLSSLFLVFLQDNRRMRHCQVFDS